NASATRAAIFARSVIVLSPLFALSAWNHQTPEGGSRTHRTPRKFDRAIPPQLRTTPGCQGKFRAPRQPLRPPLQLIAEPTDSLGTLSDLRLGLIGPHRRGDCQEPRAHLAVARITLGGEAHQLRSAMPRIVDELHESVGR